jgi:hypothetical protein
MHFSDMEILYGLLAFVLLAVLAYAVLQYRSRNKRLDPLTDTSTRKVYDTPTRDSDDEPPSPETLVSTDKR